MKKKTRKTRKMKMKMMIRCRIPSSNNKIMVLDVNHNLHLVDSAGHTKFNNKRLKLESIHSSCWQSDMDGRELLTY